MRSGKFAVAYPWKRCASILLAATIAGYAASGASQSSAPSITPTASAPPGQQAGPAPLIRRGVALSPTEPSQQPVGATNLAPHPVIAQAPAAPAPALPPVMPFNEAVSFAANNLLSKADLGSVANTKHMLVIDPLIDGNSGVQSVATETMGAMLGQLVKTTFAERYDLQPFNLSTVTRSPLLLVGTFTAVDKDMKNVGQREIYRVCLALADLKTGKLVSKGFARSSVDGVDVTPLPAFRESPAWSPDNATDGYVKTCQGTKVGDPINPAYWDKLVAAAMINASNPNVYRTARLERSELSRVNGASISGGNFFRTSSRNSSPGRVVISLLTGGKLMALVYAGRGCLSWRPMHCTGSAAVAPYSALMNDATRSSTTAV